MPNSDDLTSYCGLYCPGCDIHQSKAVHGVEDFKSVLASFKGRIAEISDEDSAQMHLERYTKVFDGGKDDFNGCPGCRRGGGIRDCKVRSCSIDRGYRTCLDCIRMESCSELRARSWALPSLRKIRDEGYDSWQKDKQKMIESGWSYLAGSDF
ncbi:MAG: DUF3795 domain-containing protein [Candidatus Thorarchaeota archaeon]|jgi:hypothetical protein